MYKKVFFLSCLCLSLLMIQCKEDESISEEMIFDPDVSSNKVNIGEQLVFTDYSTGVKSRFWTFPGGTPENSDEEEVSVVFNTEGPVTCKVEVTFLDNFTETKEFPIQVGNELYRRDIFGFENESKAIEVWKSWISDGSNAMTFSIVNSQGQGANGTNGYAKIVINKANTEVQLFTKGNTEPINAVLENNKTYEFSFWVKSDDYSQFTAAELSNESPVQAWHNFAWYSPVRQIGKEWSYKTITFNTNNLVQLYSEGFAKNAWTQFKFIQQSAGTLYIDEISLREKP